MQVDHMGHEAVVIGAGPAGLACAAALKAICGSVTLQIPILDVGTVDRIRRGKISLRPAIERISGADVRFEDGTVEQFDVIIQATGYRPNLRSLLPDHQDALDESDTPVVCGATSYPGLFFCGYIPVAIGQFREIAIEANRIARAIRTRSAAR